MTGHAQVPRRVDPVAGPAGFAKLGMNVGGVLAALARDQDVQSRQLAHVVGVLDGGNPLADLGRRRTRLGCGKEDRIHQIEVPLLAHALHEDRADHTAPADDAYLHLLIVACRWQVVGGSGSRFLLPPTSYYRPPSRGSASRSSGAAGWTCLRRSAQSWHRDRASRRDSPSRIRIRQTG
jgi:hypothetical protein